LDDAEENRLTARHQAAIVIQVVTAAPNRSQIASERVILGHLPQADMENAPYSKFVVPNSTE